LLYVAHVIAYVVMSRSHHTRCCHHKVSTNQARSFAPVSPSHTSNHSSFIIRKGSARLFACCQIAALSKLRLFQTTMMVRFTLLLATLFGASCSAFAPSLGKCPVLVGVVRVVVYPTATAIKGIEWLAGARPRAL